MRLKQPGPRAGEYVEQILNYRRSGRSIERSYYRHLLAAHPFPPSLPPLPPLSRPPPSLRPPVLHFFLEITFGLVQKAKAAGVSEAVAKATAAATLTAEREELRVAFRWRPSERSRRWHGGYMNRWVGR